MPDNVVYHAGLAFVQEEDSVSMTVTDTRLTSGVDRSPNVTPREMSACRSQGLDEERYRELKKVWAEGVSAVSASRMYHGKRGYSSRTLDKYWAAFSEAETPPPTAKGRR